MIDWGTDEDDSSTSGNWTDYEETTVNDQSSADFLDTFQSLPFEYVLLFPRLGIVNTGPSLNGHFPFFELPREIRDHVYSHVFEFQIIDILPSGDYSAERGRRYDAFKLLGPIIEETLPVSRRFLREATLAFFSTSVFRFHDFGSFSCFVDSLPFAYSGAIRSLVFRLNTSTYRSEQEREQWQQIFKNKSFIQLDCLQYLHIELSSIGRRSSPRAESRICRLQASRPGGVRPLTIVMSSFGMPGSTGPLLGLYEQAAPDSWEKMVEWWERYSLPKDSWSATRG